MANETGPEYQRWQELHEQRQKKTLVRIVREDIEQGAPGDGIGTRGGCMVRRGFERAFGQQFDSLYVLPHRVWAWNKDRADEVEFDLPDWVGEHVKEFDRGEKPHPFSFEVIERAKAQAAGR